jgi:metal-responsive CopG/Arc/MetJ family transcriptional regulator
MLYPRTPAEIRVTVPVSMPVALVESLNRVAMERRISRSALVCEALVKDSACLRASDAEVRR